MYDNNAQIKELNKSVKFYNLVLHQEFLNQTIEFSLNKSFRKKLSSELLFQNWLYKNYNFVG